MVDLEAEFAAFERAVVGLVDEAEAAAGRGGPEAGSPRGLVRALRSAGRADRAGALEDLWGLMALFDASGGSPEFVARFAEWAARFRATMEPAR